MSTDNLISVGDKVERLPVAGVLVDVNKEGGVPSSARARGEDPTIRDDSQASEGSLLLREADRLTLELDRLRYMAGR